MQKCVSLFLFFILYNIFRCYQAKYNNFPVTGRKWSNYPEKNSIWNIKEVIALDWKLEKDTLTLYPQGDLDMVSSGAIKESLDAILYGRGSLKQLIVNLSDVTFIDSSGLGMLIGCYKVMHGRQGRMMICDASERVYRLLELSGIKKLMPVMRQETSKTVRGEGYGKR